MFRIILDKTQKEELGKDIYTTVTDAITKARKEEQPYLNKKEMCQWLGVSYATLAKFIAHGLPVANIDGMKLIGKETAIKFLKEHEELL